MICNQLNILITAAGSASAINCIKAFRQQSELAVRIVAVDVSPFAAGLYLADSHYIIPLAANPDYISHILEICKTENIKFILPTFSNEIPLFAKNRALFTKNNIALMIPSLDTILTFGNKLETYNFFVDHNLTTPRTWLIQDIPNFINFPIFLKPLIGSGSKGNWIINDKDELRFFTNYLKEPYLAQEFIAGTEYTIDTLANYQSDIVAAVARERIKVKAGIAVVARTVDIASFLPNVQKVIKLGRVVGPANLQGILYNGKFYFTDINIRLAAGGLPLSIASGVNFPLLLTKMALGMPFCIPENYQTNLVMIRYYDEIFINSVSDE